MMYDHSAPPLPRSDKVAILDNFTESTETRPCLRSRKYQPVLRILHQDPRHPSSSLRVHRQPGSRATDSRHSEGNQTPETKPPHQTPSNVRRVQTMHMPNCENAKNLYLRQRSRLASALNSNLQALHCYLAMSPGLTILQRSESLGHPRDWSCLTVLSSFDR